MVTELWTGARRLPYFFTLTTGALGEESGAVLCPQCSLEHALITPGLLKPHYTAPRSLMCVRCGILIGPINDEEANG